MKKLKMLAAGACLAAISAAGAEKELSYRVQVDGVDMPLLSETVRFGSKHPDGKDESFEGPYWFGTFTMFSPSPRKTGFTVTALSGMVKL